EAIDLLKNVQVLSSPKPDNRLNRWVITAVMFLPFIVLTLIFLHNELDKTATGRLLHCEFYVNNALGFGFISLSFLVILCTLNSIAYVKLIWALDDEGLKGNPGPVWLAKGVNVFDQAVAWPSRFFMWIRTGVQSYYSRRRAASGNTNAGQTQPTDCGPA